MLDLGVSSISWIMQNAVFTYREDVPLDMRMDQRQTKTAEDIVNTYSESELYRIIRDYGEDKFAKILQNISVWQDRRHRFIPQEN